MGTNWLALPRLDDAACSALLRRLGGEGKTRRRTRGKRMEVESLLCMFPKPPGEENREMRGVSL